MTNVSLRAGGNPVPSSVLVSTDSTIDGDGTAQNPLRVVGEGVPVFERVVGEDSEDLACDPAIDLSFVQWNSGINLNIFTLNLADGTVDGFQKTIVIARFGVLGVNPKFSLVCSLDGFTQIDYPHTGGGCILIWDADVGVWRVAGLADGTLV